jgi:hypothetical protein
MGQVLSEGRAMWNLNRQTLSLNDINTATNAVIEQAHLGRIEPPRLYLGASLVGDDCPRKVQYEWWCRADIPARIRRIFDRGHYFEAYIRERLIEAGFVFDHDPGKLGFSVCHGDLQGHADGLIVKAPASVQLETPCLWEHKALNAKNFRAVERDGLAKAFPKYAAQVGLYQAYLDYTNPCLFTCIDANNCELLHFAVPFDAERAQYWSDRAAMIIVATRNSELLPRFTENSEDWRCKMCSYRGRCWST